MDPIAVLKIFWHHKFVALPILLLTLIAAGYVMQFAPRSYESAMTYAMVNPRVPSESDMEKNPELKKLNSDNPYLRSSDPSLATQVLITRLNAPATAAKLKAAGVGTDFTVSRGIGGINGFLIEITGVGATPEKSIETSKAVGAVLESDLRTIQKVNGADDTYLFTPLVVASPDTATEQFSSRLRSLIVVVIGGLVLMFGAVSSARALETARLRRGATNHSAASRTDKRRQARTMETEDPGGAHALPSSPRGGAARRTGRRSETAHRREMLNRRRELVRSR